MRQVYRTTDDFTKIFGKGYSKFFEAFQQGTSEPATPQTVLTTVPAKRLLSAPSKQASKRIRQDARASLPQMDQRQVPTVSTERSTAITIEDPEEATVNEVASPPSNVRESSVGPRQRSYSAAKGKFISRIAVPQIYFASFRKLNTRFVIVRMVSLTAIQSIEQPSRRKGVGIYAGNWSYATDEEIIPEYLRVAEKIADIEGRTTRRAYAKLTSKESAKDSSKLIRSSFENQVRKSGRARNPVDYAGLSISEDNPREVALLEQSRENGVSPTQASKQMSASVSAPSTPNRSPLMHDDQSRSTSTSTVTNTDQLERPKLSWNAIVYEVLALADGPLTFTQLTQKIKSRYPYFKYSTQEKVLKSGLKNPLYFHEAFIKGDVINGKQTWGLKPGRFVDKKTGEELTPQPRNPIGGSSRLTEQAQETEDDPSPVNVTPKASHSHRPRSSNPRFGREILNPPEIPDSQDVITSRSSPQGATSRIAAEHEAQREETTRASGLADTINGTSTIASPEDNVSVSSTQPHSQWATVTLSPNHTDSASRFSTSAGAGEQDTGKFKGPFDHEASTRVDQSPSVLHAAQAPIPSIPSSIGEGENHRTSETLQVASTPIPPVRAVSPTYVPPVDTDGDAASPTNKFIPATLSSPVTSLPDTQL